MVGSCGCGVVCLGVIFDFLVVCLSIVTISSGTKERRLFFFNSTRVCLRFRPTQSAPCRGSYMYKASSTSIGVQPSPPFAL